MHTYNKLCKYIAETYYLSSIGSILSWDSSVVMPKKSGVERAEQTSILTELIHNKLSSSELGDLIAAAKEEDLNQIEKTNLELIEKNYNHTKAISTELASEFSRATSLCELAWRQARHENNFPEFAKYFDKVLKLQREIAHIKAEKFGTSPYDALLDSYDPYRKSSTIDQVFSNLLQFLPQFIDEVIEHQKVHNNHIALTGSYSKDKQKQLGIICMEHFGFNFDAGRLDESMHPFCGGTPSDVRITTRYDEKDFISSLMGIVHETGHAIYQQNLPKEYITQPVGAAAGMTIHESQSLLIEKQLCKNRPFINWISKHIKDQFGNKQEFGADNLHKLINKVSRSFIRVDADEVTYPIHIIIRYNIEKSMIDGNLQINDIPQAWNDAMEKYLGIRPKNYSDGCLQDIHWPMGAIGYFPSYTLGAVMASQFYHTIKQSVDNLEDKIEQGNFKDLFNWLKDNVHCKGSIYKPDTLLENAIGGPIDIEIFKNYLKQKYLQ
jgi:carboxypeptidase Taq